MQTHNSLRKLMMKQTHDGTRALAGIFHKVIKVSKEDEGRTAKAARVERTMK